MSGKRTPPFAPWPEWTTARAMAFLRSALRGAFNRYPAKYAAIKRAAQRGPVVTQYGEDVKYKTGPRKGQTKYVNVYLCASCNEHFKQKEVQVDHIVPAGSLNCFEDLPSFAKRLMCGIDDLQVLCKPCHIRKTKEDST
jgi:5-methylcytosine-specific restriction endonuclease McrA